MLISVSLLAFMCVSVPLFFYIHFHTGPSLLAWPSAYPRGLSFSSYQILNFLTKNSVFLTSLVESGKPISLLVFYLTLKTHSLLSHPFPLHHELFSAQQVKTSTNSVFCGKALDLLSTL